MKKHRAVSLIEMMIVLGIITTLLGLTTIYFFNYKSGAALKISANNIMGALNLARSLAITQQVEHEVAFDLAESTYRIYAKPDTNTRLQVTLPAKIPAGVVIESTNLPIDPHAMVGDPAEIFNTTGSAEDGASIFLKNSEGKYYTLTIITATGRVRIYNYKKM